MKTLKTRPQVIEGKGGPSSAGFHKIQDIFRCSKAYQYGAVRGIHKPQYQTPDHFAWGILHHAMRARWFALRFDMTAKGWQKVLEAGQEAAEEQKLIMTMEVQRKAQAGFKMYTEHWSKRPRPDPIATEYLLGPAPLKPGDPLYMHRTARLDDASKYPEAGGLLALGESKTTSTSPGDTINQYKLHGQPLLQLLLWKMCPNGEAKYGPAAGVVLDVFKKPYGKDKPQFAREFVPVNQRVLEWYLKSIRGFLRAAERIDWNTDTPRNPQGCTYQAGRMRVPCEFRDLCMYGRAAASEYVTRDGKALHKWTPTEDETVPPWE